MSDDASELRERMERGELPRERLILAHELGHPPASEALGRDPADEDEPNPTLEFWGRRMARKGPVVMMKISYAVARRVVQEVPDSAPVRPALHEGIEATARFVEQPGESMLEPAEAAAARVARAALDLEEGSPERRACQTLLPVLRAILDVLRGGAPNRALLDGHYVRLLEQASAHPLPDEELRAAARATLLEWALS